ncbi:hypothetical protein EYV94_19290 [Puteibacter caeruleilacunae]|nr:hypothetical protein EYV94_19290 [Puteibacter caeruleilacunae]
MRSHLRTYIIALFVLLFTSCEDQEIETTTKNYSIEYQVNSSLYNRVQIIKVDSTGIITIENQQGSTNGDIAVDVISSNDQELIKQLVDKATPKELENEYGGLEGNSLGMDRFITFSSGKEVQRVEINDLDEIPVNLAVLVGELTSLAHKYSTNK